MPIDLAYLEATMGNLLAHEQQVQGAKAFCEAMLAKVREEGSPLPDTTYGPSAAKQGAEQSEESEGGQT